MLNDIRPERANRSMFMYGILLSIFVIAAYAGVNDDASSQVKTAEPTPAKTPAKEPSDEGGMPNFVPTEKVSADQAVAFPTDI